MHAWKYFACFCSRLLIGNKNWLLKIFIIKYGLPIGTCRVIDARRGLGELSDVHSSLIKGSRFLVINCLVHKWLTDLTLLFAVRLFLLWFVFSFLLQRIRHFRTGDLGWIKAWCESWRSSSSTSSSTSATSASLGKCSAKGSCHWANRSVIFILTRCAFALVLCCRLLICFTGLLGTCASRRRWWRLVIIRLFFTFDNVSTLLSRVIHGRRRLAHVCLLSLKITQKSIQHIEKTRLLLRLGILAAWIEFFHSQWRLLGRCRSFLSRFLRFDFFFLLLG